MIETLLAGIDSAIRTIERKERETENQEKVAYLRAAALRFCKLCPYQNSNYLVVAKEIEKAANEMDEARINDDNYGKNHSDHVRVSQAIMLMQDEIRYDFM